MTGFKPSSYQQAIFDFVESGQGSALVEAVAGSGKTTTIVEALKLIPDNQRVLFLAFNKKIATELGERVPDYVKAATFHSVGFGAWRSYATGRVRVDGRKIYNLICDHWGEENKSLYWGYVTKLVSLAKSHGIGYLLPDIEASWYGLIDHFDLNLDRRTATEPKAIELARDLLAKSNELENSIDFDDMLFLPLINDVAFQSYDWVFVDEAQDTNLVQLALLERIVRPETGRLVAVGDTCQPTGTVLDVVIKSGNRWHRPIIEKMCIEDVNVGDIVISLSSPDRQWNRSKKVTGKSSRPYSDDLVVVSTEGSLVSKYTLNHHCVVNFAPLSDKYCVYIMRRGGKYRIGKSKLDYGQSGSGVKARMAAEDADAVWILDVYDTDVQAYIAEQVISANYGIPQIMFIAANNSTLLTEELLESVWQSIVPNGDRTVSCLKAYGRNLLYPIFSKDDPKWYSSLKRPFVTHAVNIIDGCAVLPYTHGDAPISGRDSRERAVRKSDWVIATVYREYYEGLVHSLEIEDDHTYVADSILTHNCQAIYGFRGADSEATNNIRKAFSATTLPLSVSYRCAKAVVAAAQEYVPHIQPFENSPVGKVEDLEANWTTGQLTAHDAILCRNTAPLVRLCFRFIRDNIPAKVLGREIGEGLIRLVGKLEPTDVDDLETKLCEYRERELAKLLSKGREDKAQALNDRVDSIEVVIENLKESERTLAGLEGRITSLFKDTGNGILTLCTIHRSKGLEWDRVFVLDRWELQPSKWARKEWQKVQENNLIYVAYTRAKKELYLIKS